METAIDIEITVNVSNSQPHLRDDLWEGNRSSSIVDDVDDDIFDSSSFNAETLVTVITLTVITIVTIVGNVLVILSVFTYKPLRIVQNFFIVSLAVADLTVAILVMPLNIVYNILGKWVFGLVICEMWLTCDVLCCTASILNLCAIALDRYRAITDPLNYAQKRTFKRVMLMIVLVWAISGIICLPPLIGWNDWPDDFDESYECRLTEEKGYVIYSSCGSFYIPLLIMTLVYIKIFMATRRRLRERARASKISVAQNLSKPPRPLERTSSFTPSEANHNEDTCANVNHKQANGKEQRTPKTPRTNPKEESNENTQPTTNDLSNNKKQKKNSSRKKDKIAGDKDGSLRGMTTAEASASIPQFIEERQKISLTRERRAARTLGIIMGVFVVCWLPFFLMYVIIPFCEKACPISDSMINFITWLGYINSCLNPVIYTIFNIDFRRAFAKLLKCK